MKARAIVIIIAIAAVFATFSSCDKEEFNPVKKVEMNTATPQSYDTPERTIFENEDDETGTIDKKKRQPAPNDTEVTHPEQ